MVCHSITRHRHTCIHLHGARMVATATSCLRTYCTTHLHLDQADDQPARITCARFFTLWAWGDSVTHNFLLKICAAPARRRAPPPFSSPIPRNDASLRRPPAALVNHCGPPHTQPELYDTLVGFAEQLQAWNSEMLNFMAQEHKPESTTIQL